MPTIEVPVEDWQLAAIEQRAQRDGVDVAEALRAVVTKGLAAEGPAAKYRALRERQHLARAR